MFKTFKEFLNERASINSKHEYQLSDLNNDSVYIGVFDNKHTFISLNIRPECTFKDAIEFSSNKLPSSEMLKVIFDNQSLTNFRKLIHEIKEYLHPVWISDKPKDPSKAYSFAYSFLDGKRNEFHKAANFACLTYHQEEV
jgi:hypothetical protein